ncbi:unnamed protein product [Rotaria sordida]|uniref:Uncharacterized protein n=1 Tax=Rotaria sordida TaxID=392033 RepID=A0A814DL20_9BILA|nr:unnamed protein product [Rotaria sordida]
MERSRCDYSQPRYDRPLTAAITQTCKPETSACFKETSACFKETSPCYKEVSPCFKETSPCIQSDFVFAHHPRTLAFGRKVRQDHFDVCHPTYSYGSCYCSTPVSYKPMCRCGSSCYCDNMGKITYRDQRCRPARATFTCLRESVPIIQRVCVRPCPSSCFDLRKKEKIITRDSYRYEHQKGFKSPTTHETTTTHTVTNLQAQKSNQPIVSGQQTSCGDKERYTEHHQTYFEPRSTTSRSYNTYLDSENNYNTPSTQLQQHEVTSNTS